MILKSEDIWTKIGRGRSKEKRKRRNENEQSGRIVRVCVSVRCSLLEARSPNPSSFLIINKDFFFLKTKLVYKEKSLIDHE